MTVLSLLSAVFNHTIIALPQAIIAALGAFGLKRGDAWSGYGLALFLCCSTAAAIFAVSRIGSLQNPYLLTGAIVPLVAGAFAFLAGKELASQDPPSIRSSALWVIASLVPISLSLFFSLLKMPTASMEPTILDGDNIVMRSAGGSEVKRGDLVVYRERGKEVILVKRVVGIGGDRIHLDHKTLYLNGRAVQERYVEYNTRYLDQYRDNFPLGEWKIPLSKEMHEQLATQVRDADFVVPSGTFFVLGDNRDLSLDSRYTGVIPASAILGQAWLLCRGFSCRKPTISPRRN
jgi:signal peptidase I